MATHFCVRQKIFCYLFMLLLLINIAKADINRTKVGYSAMGAVFWPDFTSFWTTKECCKKCGTDFVNLNGRCLYDPKKELPESSIVDDLIYVRKEGCCSFCGSSTGDYVYNSKEDKCEIPKTKSYFSLPITPLNPKSVSDLKCQICEYVALKIEKDHYSSMEEIENTCYVFSALKQFCKELVSTKYYKIVESLKLRQSPMKICGDFNLCPKPLNKNKNDKPLIVFANEYQDNMD